jgi:hypothetical protein
MSRLQEDESGEREPLELDVLALRTDISLVVGDVGAIEVRGLYDSGDVPTRSQTILLSEVLHSILAMPEMSRVR